MKNNCKKNRHKKISSRVALISAPWPVYNRPSIQLGVLKAALLKDFPELEVKSHHFYLNIAEKTGYRLYHEISEKSWLSESVYSALLFPEKKEEISNFFNKEAKGSGEIKKTDLNKICKTIKTVSDDIINKINWNDFIYIGFSICLCQLTSSLYFINQIKKKYPEIPIIVGGSLFSGLDPEEIFKAFKRIDIIINGEGETPLSSITEQFLRGKKKEDISPVPGVYINKKKGLVSCSETENFNQITNLDTLPVPDYDDYFQLLEKLPPEKKFFPTLSAEISRGCWWKRKSENGLPGCAFCNLNLQWKGYRSKSPEKITSEIDCLTSKYKTLSVSFMDNVIPLNKSKRIFDSLYQLNKDFSFFCEIRADFSYKNLLAMKKAGVLYVQVGIEALSSNLLYKINKGTSAIQNMEIMKNCEEAGIFNNSNLILYFPTSDEEDVAETLKALDYAEIFRPLKTVRFQLCLGSSVMAAHKAFNLNSVFNHKNYNILFPDHITRSIRFINQAYKGDLGVQKKLWQPVKKRVLQWEDSYKRLHTAPCSGPILSFREGGEFLIIRKRKENGEHDTHRLTGPSRKIYLFCRTRKSFKEIKAKFPKLSARAIFSFLSMMTDKRLMFEENEIYLSLACRR